MSIDQIEDELRKMPQTKKDWEDEAILNWLDNPNFCDFFIAVYKIWFRKDEVLDAKLLHNYLRWLHRTTISDYMNRLVSSNLAIGNNNSKGGLKSITPAYNEGRELKMRKYMRKAYTFAIHK